MVSRAVNLILRGFEFLFTLLIMALVGNMIASSFAGNPSVINYDMFVVVFAMLSLFYLIAVSFNDSFTGHPIIPSRTSILETLPKVVINPPKLTPKSTISRFEKFFFNIRQAVTGHVWITLIIIAVVLAAGSFLSKRRVRRGRSFGSDTGFFNLDTKEKLLSSLGGSTTNGKVD